MRPEKQQIFSQITSFSALNVAFNTFMHQAVFFNHFNSLFEGVLLLCRKPCSLKPSDAKPFPLHLLVVEGSHQGTDPSPVISKLYSKQPHIDNTHFLGSGPQGICSGVTDEHGPTAVSGAGSDTASCPGHRQPSTVPFPQFAAVQIQKKLFPLLTALY